MKITVSSPIDDTPRVAQIRGMFDLPEAKTSTVSWDVEMPLTSRHWNIGLIVGPSGCGKSTIARHLWPGAPKPTDLNWPAQQSILDAFPEGMPIKMIAEILSSVGFSSPPAWLRPFHVLSNGQQFRVTLALLIANALKYTGGLPGNQEEPAQHHTPIVFDEYTSVVDRNVAKIGSAALAKTVRAKKARFVAITCHEDVEDWIQPDWVYRPAERTFAWRLLRPRPTIPLAVFRCEPKAWALFAPHHYLTDKQNSGCVSFMATWNNQPVAYSSWVPWFGAGPPARREHRTVTLPDFQGVGIGNKLSTLIAGMWKALGLKPTSTTTHPAMIAARQRSTVWKMTRSQSLMGTNDTIKHASDRLTAGFEYIGPPMLKIQAKALHGH